MNNLEMCRICTSYVNASCATNLFEDNHTTYLEHVKELTGQLLRNKRILPKHICPACEENLKRAHSFRKRCIDSQQYFKSTKYTQFLQRKQQHYFQHDSAESKDEQEISIVKDETNSTYVNDTDLLDIYSEQKSPSLNKSLFEINILQNEECEFKKSLEIDSKSTIDAPKNGKKVKSKLKKKKFNKQTVQKVPSLKVKKSDEKVELICDQCGNHFNCRHHFLTHLRRHSKDKPFKCEVCPDKFYTHSELKRHMRRHTGERPFACQFCQRCFTDYSTRIKHERIHTNERPYSCSQCGKAFTTSYVLKNHMLVHTGERSFKCSLCNKSFQRQTHLTVHYRSIMHKQMLEKQQSQQNMLIMRESVAIECENDLNGLQ